MCAGHNPLLMSLWIYHTLETYVRTHRHCCCFLLQWRILWFLIGCITALHYIQYNTTVFILYYTVYSPAIVIYLHSLTHSENFLFTLLYFSVLHYSLMASGPVDPSSWPFWVSHSTFLQMWKSSWTCLWSACERKTLRAPQSSRGWWMALYCASVGFPVSQVSLY